MTKEPWIVEIDGEMLSEIKSKEEQEWMVTICSASSSDGYMQDMNQFTVVGTSEQVLDYLWENFLQIKETMEGFGAKMVVGPQNKDGVFKNREYKHDTWIQERLLAESGYPIFYVYNGLFQDDKGVVLLFSIQAEMLLRNKRIQLS